MIIARHNKIEMVRNSALANVQLVAAAPLNSMTAFLNALSRGVALRSIEGVV